jgi:hypothetical protein
MVKVLSTAVVLVAAALAVAVTPSRAAACGGCFAPSETVTVVTGHRMAVALSPTETTLWDQITYAGNPEDFVWILPIQGEVLVELADNAFFEALSNSTGITLQGTFAPPRTFCPDPCDDFSFGASAGRGAEDGGGTMEPPPVTVYGEATVGPYETATIGSTDPGALVAWLRDHGYAVPESAIPIIAHYVDAGLNFAALRLSPNSGVNQMQPVRVTTPGMMPVFPLEMVAVGATGSLGLELYVFAEGRSEAQNFPVVQVDGDDLYYDWETTTFNYAEAFDLALDREGSGRAWVAEFAQSDSYASPFTGSSWRSTVESYVSYDEAGAVLGSSMDDFAVVTRSIARPYLTKLRTDMAVEHLDQDLVLQAALDDAAVDPYFNVSRERNRPDEPVCSDVCIDPTRPGGSVAGGTAGTIGFGSAGRGDGLCAAAPATGAHATFALLVLGALLAATRRRS